MMRRQSLKLDEIDWQVLTGIAADFGCEYRSEPSWRRLMDWIAGGKLTVVNNPDKRIQAFQEKMRDPQRGQQLARTKARLERDRLRQERKRRAMGIAPRGAQKQLEIATGHRDRFGALNEEPTP